MNLTLVMWNFILQNIEKMFVSCNMDGLVNYCSISNALAMKLLQSCAKPLIYFSVLTIRQDIGS